MRCEYCRDGHCEGCPISEEWLERLLTQVADLKADARTALILERVFGAPLATIARVLATSSQEAAALQRLAEAELRASCVQIGCGCGNEFMPPGAAGDDGAATVT